MVKVAEVSALKRVYSKLLCTQGNIRAYLQVVSMIDVTKKSFLLGLISD